MEWVLFQFDFSTSHHNLSKFLSNVRQTSMWCSQVRRELNPQIIRTTRGCPRFNLQIGVSVLPWMANLRNWEWKKQPWIGNSHFLIEIWKWRIAFWGICAIGMRKQLLMQSTTWLSWWIWHRVEKPIRVKIWMKSQWRGLMWMIGQHHESSFLKPASMPNYYQLCSWASFKVFSCIW